MSYLWSFQPDDPHREPEPPAYRPIKKPKNPLWVAPEHERAALSMRRDYPRDNRGEAIKEQGRRLVVDPRPQIMVPARRTRIGWL